MPFFYFPYTVHKLVHIQLLVFFFHLIFCARVYVAKWFPLLVLYDDWLRLWFFYYTVMLTVLLLFYGIKLVIIIIVWCYYIFFRIFISVFFLPRTLRLIIHLLKNAQCSSNETFIVLGSIKKNIVKFLFHR